MELENKINDQLKLFDVITLSEMSKVGLMNRIDTKFVCNINQLEAILKELPKYYKILEVNSLKLLKYSSLYFDTAKLKFYNDHHNGKLNRTKVRFRKYVDSDLTFLEVKQKSGNGRTRKTRINVSDINTSLNDEKNQFIESVTKVKFALRPTLNNSFKRMTLVDREEKERATIDIGLNVSADGTNKTFEKLVIIELKQVRIDRSSKLFEIVKKHGIHPYRISKYCIGMVTTKNNIKYNIFKRKLLKINKISA